MLEFFFFLLISHAHMKYVRVKTFTNLSSLKVKTFNP